MDIKELILRNIKSVSGSHLFLNYCEITGFNDNEIFINILEDKVKPVILSKYMDIFTKALKKSLNNSFIFKVV